MGVVGVGRFASLEAASGGKSSAEIDDRDGGIGS